MWNTRWDKWLFWNEPTSIFQPLHCQCNSESRSEIIHSILSRRYYLFSIHQVNVYFINLLYERYKNRNWLFNIPIQRQKSRSCLSNKSFSNYISLLYIKAAKLICKNLCISLYCERSDVSQYKKKRSKVAGSFFIYRRYHRSRLRLANRFESIHEFLILTSYSISCVQQILELIDEDVP